MRKVGVDQLVELMVLTGQSDHKKELLRFIKSPNQAVELKRYSENLRTDSISYAYAKKGIGVPVKIFSRGKKLYAVKTPVYDAVEEYRKSDRYADSIMNEVKQAEARAEFLREFGEAYY